MGAQGKTAEKRKRRGKRKEGENGEG